MQMKEQTSRRTDKNDETNNRYSQFCECASYVEKNTVTYTSVNGMLYVATKITYCKNRAKIYL